MDPFYLHVFLLQFKCTLEGLFKEKDKSLHHIQVYKVIMQFLFMAIS